MRSLRLHRLHHTQDQKSSGTTRHDFVPARGKREFIHVNRRQTGNLRRVEEQGLRPATFRSGGKNEARWLVAAYDDSFLRVNGTWMFKTLRVHVNFLEPHQGTWASSAVL